MPFAFNSPEEREDRDLLADFFRQLETFLRRLTHEPGQYLGQGRYIEGGDRILRSMWAETEAAFGPVHIVVREANHERLAQAGLSGKSLRGKLDVVVQWATRLLSSPGVGILKKILGAINTLLGSFTQATGVGELIKEFKETVENIIDDVTR